MESMLVCTTMGESSESADPEVAAGDTVSTLNALEGPRDDTFVDNQTGHQRPGSVVILRSDPMRLPMVCGLCGNQFATAKELGNHMNVHREGDSFVVKRGRGRPKGSRTRKIPVDSASENEVVKETAATNQSLRYTVESDNSTRRSQRPVKRPNSDVYVHDDKELDDLLERERNVTSHPKGSSSNIEGVKIARLEDFVPESVPLIPNANSGADGEGLNETELNEGLFDIPNKAHSVVIDPSGAPNQQDGGEEVDTNVSQLMSSGNLGLSNEHQTTNLLVADGVVDGEVNCDDADVTHIEVCLEVFGNEFASQTGTTGSEIVATSGSRMCELCFSVLPVDKMKEHMINVHMDITTQEFSCPKPDCHTTYSSIAKLREHMTEVHQTPAAGASLPRVYACEVPDCNTIYKTKSSLKLHIAEAHSDLAQQATTCEICHKVFKSKRAHSSHMKAHTKVLEPVQCPKCGKQFKHPSALKFHMSMMPECDKPKYVCECGYKAVTPWRLNSHKQQVHSTARPYTCEFCQKTYKTNEMLRQHKYKLHTGTPTFECDICGKKLFYAAELREHSQLHATTKEYVCEICNRAFKTMHVYRGHMNGKHSNTWYSCGFCKFTTSHKKSMKRHMILVHKLKNVTLEVTPEVSSMLPEQVEIIQNDTELHSLQLSENGQVINSIQHVQYEDVGDHSVVMQHADTGEVMSHDQITGEVISDEHIVGQVITQEQMDELIRTHQQAVAGSMNVSEVSQVLVSLSSSGGVVTDTTDTAVAEDVLTHTLTDTHTQVVANNYQVANTTTTSITTS